MLHELLLAVHITGVVGWAGLTAGGYFVLAGCGEAGFPRYAKLVYLQLLSALSIFATGLAMAAQAYGLLRPRSGYRPPWPSPPSWARSRPCTWPRRGGDIGPT